MERWKAIHDFPRYFVSSEGRIKNGDTGRIMALTLNQQGIVQVGFSDNGKYFKRAVAPLVAHAFIPRPMGPFDTPINLDGDRTNNSVENLMWRPRWFATVYHRQFRHPYAHPILRPIVDMETRVVSDDSRAAAVQYGLLEKDIVLSILNRTVVWPTYQEFRVLEE
jgi:hypothetical protein